jgi:GNAT superfamily N-acetyltransferase
VSDFRKGPYWITTDPEKLDVDAIHAYLSRSFWAEGIPKGTVARAIAHSLCFGLFDGAPLGDGSGRPERSRGTQIGFARVVTDRATFAYLCDVYVLESHRGRGLGKWLIEIVMAHPDLQGLRRFQLVTRDAHGLYRRHGFETPINPERHMEIFRHGMYLERSEPWQQ